jgi:hypothetical protein
MHGFSIPVNAKDNLAPDGQVFVNQYENDCERVVLSEDHIAVGD